LHVYAVASFLDTHNEITVPVTKIEQFELERISALQTPQQVLLVIKQKLPTDEPIVTGKITLLRDGIKDPGNMGTIIRTADWFGIDQLICTNDCVDIYNPKVVQASMGSITRLKVWYEDVQPLLQNATVPVYGAFLDGTDVYTLPQSKEGILVIGNEGKGIRSELQSFITQRVTIAKKGGAESLNAAIAAGIIMSVLTR